MTIDLYHMPISGPCRTVRMVAKLIGVDLNLKYVDLMAGEQNKPEFLKGKCDVILQNHSEKIKVFGTNLNLHELARSFQEMNPEHCIPTIDDDGFILWESRAIITYLVNKYAPDSSLYPKDAQQRAMVDRLLYFDIGTLYKSLREVFHPQIFKGEAPSAESEKNYQTALGYLEGYLSNSPYVAGDKFTLADISIMATLSTMELDGSIVFFVTSSTGTDVSLQNCETGDRISKLVVDTVQIAHSALDYDCGTYPNISAWKSKVKEEIPDYKSINDEPLQELKAWIKSKKAQ